MALNPGQQQVSVSPARFRVVIAGRRWGKTYLAIRETAKVARFPNRRCYLVYPTYRQAKNVIWDSLKQRMSELNWIDKINESDLTIRLKNNSTISLRGADNFDSLRGVGLDWVCMDEFAMCDSAAWQQVLRATLSDRQGRALFISTPMGTSNWAYDLYQRGLDPEEHQWESFSYRTIDGLNVSSEEIEQARRDLDERSFRQEYEATFENYVNRVFYNWDRQLNTRPRPEQLPNVLHVGMDFNVGNMSATVWISEQNQCHMIDEILLPSSNTTEMADELRQRYPRTKLFVYPDPSGSARKSAAASGVTDHTILANAGFVVKAPRAHNPVRDGINAVNSMLCNAAGERRLFVDSGCKRAIESMEKYTYKEGTSQPDKDSGYDHFADSIRYFVDYVYPVRREIEYQPPERWAHRV